MDKRKPVCVMRPNVEWQAQMIVQYLKDGGVDAFLANRASVGLWGDGTMPVVGLEVLVPAEQKETAESMIEDYGPRIPDDLDAQAEESDIDDDI